MANKKKVVKPVEEAVPVGIPVEEEVVSGENVQEEVQTPVEVIPPEPELPPVEEADSGANTDLPPNDEDMPQGNGEPEAPSDPENLLKQGKSFEDKWVKNQKKANEDAFSPSSFKELVVWYKTQCESGVATKREFINHANKLLASDSPEA